MRNKEISPFQLAAYATAVFGLTFGPRAYGHALFDVISWISIGIIAVSFVTMEKISPLLSKMQSLLLGFMVLLLLTLVSSNVNSGESMFTVIRSARALINFLAVSILSSWVVSRHPTAGRNALLIAIVLAAFAHSIIMIVQYIHPDLRSVIYAISGFDKMKVTRVTGLTATYNTLNLVNGTALVASVWILPTLHRGLLKALVYISIPLTTAASLLAGRTALVIGMFLFLVSAIFIARTKRGLLSLLPVGICSYALLSIMFLSIPTVVRENFLDYTFYFLSDSAFGLLGENSSEENYGHTTLDTVKAMYFIPDDLITTLIGNASDSRSDNYVPSDAGFILNLFSYGLFGTLTILAIYLVCFARGIIHMRRNFMLGFLLSSFALYSIVLHLKEQVLLTRHGLTVLSILYTIVVLPQHPPCSTKRLKQ